MKKETVCVQSGTYQDPQTGSSVTPIFTSSSFEYIGRDDQAYPRYFNTPNQAVVSEKVAALEGAEAGIPFGSGMAAISTAILANAKPGDHLVIQSEIYGGTSSFVSNHLIPAGFKCSFAATSAEAVIEACSDKTTVIYIETPTNPLLSVIDIKKVADFARANGIITIIDNTFATPILQNPIGLGIDIVIHSGTKYLGGHSDLSCGIALSTHELIGKLSAKAKQLGGCLNAQDAYLLERSLKTLAIRVERQSSNALKLAEWLEESDSISRVFYPGLKSSPYHELAKSQMSAFGGILSFELAKRPAKQFLQRLKVIRPAMSNGGVETLICSPAETSHFYITQKERNELGISDQLLRLSVGIENVEDLIEDIQQAF